MRDRVLIIAEAGVNHNGSIDLAYRLIDEAKRAGADIVKFQTAIPEESISRFAEKAQYQKDTTGAAESQLDMVKKIALPLYAFDGIKLHCKEAGIQFLSTPFDLESIKRLDEIGCDFWKIPSGEVTNYQYLVAIAKTHKPIVMSTGMCTMEDIAACMDLLRTNGAGEITLLHCNTQYPTPYEDVNLNAMLSLKEEFGVEVGYSDHTCGIEVPIAAVALGAKVIEKHFTLDRNMIGPDHKASIEPDELQMMVNSIRHIEAAMGDGIKRPSASELGNKLIARKSIVARTQIHKGELFTENNLAAKRPGTGISPMRWNEVIGTRAIRDFGEDEMIEIILD